MNISEGNRIGENWFLGDYFPKGISWRIKDVEYGREIILDGLFFGELMKGKYVERII